MIRLLRRLRYLLQRHRHERELDDELQFHLEMKQRELESRGLDRAAAAAAARRTFGNLPLTRDHVRDVWIAPWLQSVAHDVRSAGRLPRRNGRFTIAAVAALACGIGASTTGFTVVNAVTRGLPVDEPDRIVRVGVLDASQRPVRVSPREFEVWRSASTVAGIAAFSPTMATVSERGRSPEPVAAAYVSADTFGLLGERPVLGREFLAEDDRPGAPVVALLGDAVWRSRFDGDRSILDRSITVDDVPVTIVGVMPAGFRFPMVADLWLPLSAMPGYGEDRNARVIDVVGRLGPGRTPTQAVAELEPIALRLAQDLPEPGRATAVTVAPFTGDIRPMYPFLIALMASVGLVLLIACVNVANLLLARALARTRETAVRLAHGATRWRVLRQLLVESALLTAVAGAVAVVLAMLATRLLSNTLASINFPYWLRWTMDGRVVLFVVLVCVVSAAISGLWPAVHLARSPVMDGLREGGRSATLGSRPRRLVASLLAVELAFTLVLLAGAGLMTRSFLSLYRADLVIDPTNVLSTRIALPPARYPTPEAQTAFFRQLEEQLGGLSTIGAAAFADTVPFIGAPRRALSVDGRADAPDAPRPSVSMVSISPAYFETLGVRLMRGRAFTEADMRQGSGDAIVNERLAAMFFPDQEPIGKRIRLSGGPTSSQDTAPWLTVVGVAPSVRQQPTLGLQDLDPVVYVPRTPASGPVAWLLVRGAPSATSVATVVRERIWTLDPDVALARLVPLDETISQSRWTVRVFAGMFATFAWIAMVLSAVGLYAVTAYSVTQRRQEVGVRMALGAQRGDIVWLFTRRAFVSLSVGLVAGIAGAFAIGPLLRAFLVQTSPGDPVTLAAVAGVLVVVAAVASVWPALRATRVRPAMALRTE